jgi:hypothetical protein
MIYRLPAPDEPLDQGDIIQGCPLVIVESYDPERPEQLPVTGAPTRVIILTQACDLVNQKAKSVVVAAVLDAQALVAQGLLKVADIKGPIRAGRVFGWYFLPKSAELGLPEMIVDLRQLHTVRRDLLLHLCQRGQRQARVQPLYREHLAKHMADTYCRIGLPQPYETD